MAETSATSPLGEVETQTLAVRLLRRGLRPKQVSGVTGIPVKRLRRLAAEVRGGTALAGSPKTPEGILRTARDRQSAAIFIGIHQRFGGDWSVGTINWELFFEAYDAYADIMADFGSLVTVLPTDQAYTLCVGLRSGLVELSWCATHALPYVRAPRAEDEQRCPYCIFDDGRGQGRVDPPVDADPVAFGRKVTESGHLPCESSSIEGETLVPSMEGTTCHR